jgi:hypothetical protein
MSLFAFITAAIAAKLRSHSDVEATRRIAELEAELKDLQARLDVALEDARRWEALASSWQRRYAATPLLGAQDIGFDAFCNCVPSRTQVWVANRN